MDAEQYFDKDGNLTPQTIKKVKAWSLEQMEKEYSKEELEFIRSEEKKMVGDCPNSLYLDGITLKPERCEQHHCPWRFNCLTYTGERRVEIWK